MESRDRTEYLDREEENPSWWNWDLGDLFRRTQKKVNP
jgi:hypothetical protein